MKQSSQSTKCTTSSSNSKSKKNYRDKEKRKSQGSSSESSNHNSTEKGSPSKDSNARQYAGIDSESLAIYAEQSAFEHLSEEISNALTEDINYKLRHIINDALVKARLSGRTAISSSDLEQTFENLHIDRVYGAPTNPTWVQFGYQNLFYLDDNQVNLVEIAEEESVYIQPGETVLTKTWMPEQKEISDALKNYFTTMCQMIVSEDGEVRRMALKNIAENPRIGPITRWFYNFGYILLSKDITYDCLTLRALDLIRVLENSPTCRINVLEKQLQLLVRLILQRLLKSITTAEVLKPMCSVLAILCIRQPLREFVISKMVQKMGEVCQTYALSVISIANSLGVDAIMETFLPNMNLFLTRVMQTKDPELTYSVLELYYIMCKAGLVDPVMYNAFHEIFGDSLVAPHNFVQPKIEAPIKKEMNFVKMKLQLLKTRRHLSFSPKPAVKRPIEEAFDMPPEDSELRKKLDAHNLSIINGYLKNDSGVVIGKTSLLLPVLRDKKSPVHPKCSDHSLLILNL